MNKHLPGIESLFRDGLDNLEEMPAAGSWKKIEAALDREEAARQKSKFSPVKKGAVIAVMLLLGITVCEVSELWRDGQPVTENNPAGTRCLSGRAAGNGQAMAIGSANHAGSGLTVLRKPAGTTQALLQRNDLNTYNQETATGFTITDAGIMGDMKNGLAAMTTVNSFAIAAGETRLAERKNVLPAAGFLQVAPLPAVVSLPSLHKQSLLFTPYWTISAMASLDRSQYILDNDVKDRSSGPVQDEKTAIARREEHRPSFSAGIRAAYQFKRQWAIQAGIVYEFTQIGIHPQKIYANPNEAGAIWYKYNSSSGYAYIEPGFAPTPAIGDSLSTTEAKHTLTYLSIPLMIRHDWTGGRFGFSTGVGLSANTLLNAKLETEVRDASNRETVTINKLDGLHRMYIGLVADASLQYTINSRWSLSVIPSFNYALTPINSNNVVKTYPYSLGLGMGVLCRL